MSRSLQMNTRRTSLHFRLFSSTSRAEDHYRTLGLTPQASKAQIKVCGARQKPQEIRLGVMPVPFLPGTVRLSLK